VNLADYLPEIAAVLANPVLGVAEIAAKFVAGRLGLKASTVESVRATLLGMSPDQLVKIKQIDTDFLEHMDDNKTKLEEIEVDDRKSARERDTELSKATAGRPNYMAISMYVLAVSACIWLVYEVLTDTAINEYVKGIVTLVLGRFLGYLDGIYQFEFGSTRSGRTKDDTINKLSG
jgi:hypothetical protein